MGVSLEANLQADIAAALGGVQASLKKMDAYLAKLAEIPVNWRYTNSGVTTTQQLMFDLGGPAQGYKWDCRRVVVYTADVTQSPAGVGFLFAGTVAVVSGQGFPLPGQLELLDKAGTTFPVPAYYSAEQNVIHYPEHFVFAINAATNGTNYIVSAAGIQYPETALVEVAT